jgi:hypothetical protein
MSVTANIVVGELIQQTEEQFPAPVRRKQPGTFQQQKNLFYFQSFRKWNVQQYKQQPPSGLTINKDNLIREMPLIKNYTLLPIQHH